MEENDPILDLLIGWEGNGFANDFCGSITETGHYYGLHINISLSAYLVDGEWVELPNRNGFIYHEGSLGFRDYESFDSPESLAKRWDQLTAEQDTDTIYYKVSQEPELQDDSLDKTYGDYSEAKSVYDSLVADGVTVRLIKVYEDSEGNLTDEYIESFEIGRAHV